MICISHPQLNELLNETPKHFYKQPIVKKKITFFQRFNSVTL